MKAKKNFDFSYIKRGRSIYVTVVGTLILSFGVAVFIIPFRLVAGGISGLAVVLEAAIPLRLFTAELLAALLSWAFFVLGWVVFGRAFSVKTLLATAVYPLGISLFSPLTSEQALDTLYLSHGSLLPIAAAVIGGVLVGVGCAVIFQSGGSSGGTDVLALILCRHFPKIKSATAILMTDVLIILLGMAVIGSPYLSLLGILHAAVCAAVIHLLLANEL